MLPNMLNGYDSLWHSAVMWKLSTASKIRALLSTSRYLGGCLSVRLFVAYHRWKLVLNPAWRHDAHINEKKQLLLFGPSDGTLRRHGWYSSHPSFRLFCFYRCAGEGPGMFCYCCLAIATMLASDIKLALVHVPSDVSSIDGPSSLPIMLAVRVCSVQPQCWLSIVKLALRSLKRTLIRLLVFSDLCFRRQGRC